MKNVWSIICEKSSIDSQTNVLSLFNCIEEMNIDIDKTKMPQSDKIIIPVNFQLISLWRVDDSAKENTMDVKMELIDPSGQVLNESLNTLVTKKGEKRLRSVINIQGLQVTDSGVYYYKILEKKGNKFEVVSSTPLDINVSYRILLFFYLAYVRNFW